MKTVDIESLLHWAYLEELPKAADRIAHVGPSGVGNGWLATGNFLGLLAVVDIGGAALVADRSRDADPHPDAIAVHEAVRALDDVVDFDWAGFDAFVDMPQIGDDADRASSDAAFVLRPRLGALVIRHALAGTAPDWAAEPPRAREVVCPVSGKPLWFVRERMAVLWDAAGEPVKWAEVEMRWQRTSGRAKPPPHAYRKREWLPSLLDIAVARAEYTVWRACLDVLEAQLDGVLSAHRVAPSVRSWTPWVEGEPAPPRVLRDLTEVGRVVGEVARGRERWQVVMRLGEGG